MELLALLSNSDDLVIPTVKEVLKKYTVYPLKTLDELEDLYSNIPLNLFLIDTTSHRLSTLEDFLKRLDESIVIVIASEKLDRYTMDTLPQSVFDCIDVESIRTELPGIVERALERQKFRNELRLLKESRDIISPMQMQVYNRGETEPFSGRCETIPGGWYFQERVIVNFARMLTVSFDMRKLLDHFMDSVMEIARVSKMSVMLREKDGYHVKSYYGIDPYIADNLRLKKDSSLVTWLAKTGRIMHKPTSFPDTDSVNLKNEMEILQCSVSFPIIYKGKLIGIFNIDNKITEEPFYREELEIIYMLCNYLAAAVKDIDHYHQMWYQKEFTKNLISSMSSGMIAIDRNEKVTIFNQQAAEILNLDPSEIIGSDLRVLPSPLGDILFETMETGTLYKRYEVTINPLNLPLGINSYRLLDEQRNPIGAGIIFTDLSDSKKLEEQRRRAEKLEAINDLMAKIAHEVRNPLTSIQTFTQLLNEKYADDDLNKFYNSTVTQSINTLNSLIDKLVTFSSTQNYNFEKEDINKFISEAVDFVSKNMPETHKFSKQFSGQSFYLNIDKKQFIKAIYYLVLSIVDRTPEGTSISMKASTVIQDDPFAEILISYSSDESIELGKKDLLKPLLDIDHLGTELNIPISHKIIEGHNGELDIKSEEGVNAFVIKLPIVDRRSSKVSVKGGHIGER
jgi:nitrogen-specific signal transduction histidine kinase